MSYEYVYRYKVPIIYSNDECHITVILLKVLIHKQKKHCHDTMLLYDLNGKQYRKQNKTKKYKFRSIKRKSLR